MANPRNGEPPSETLRSTLQRTVNDGHTKAILIGENHMGSYTPDAILANLDILEQVKKSGRDVVFVFEDLPGKANESSAQYAEAVGKKNFEHFNLFNTLQSKGIKVFGTENKKSNPFMDIDPEVATKEQRIEMGKYGGSIERTKNANEVFSEVIQKQGPNALVVFVGGAAHVPQAKLGDEVKDVGMVGRIPDAKTILLTASAASSPNDVIQQNYAYTNSDTRATGQYDYNIGSTANKVFKNRFDAASSLEDKKQVLAQMLNDLSQSFIQYPQKAGSGTFNEKYNRIIEEFKNSANLKDDTYTFAELGKMRQEILKRPEAKNVASDIINAIATDTKRQAKVNFSSTAAIMQGTPPPQPAAAAAAPKLDRAEKITREQTMRSSRIVTERRPSDLRPLQPVAANTQGLENRTPALDPNRPTPATSNNNPSPGTSNVEPSRSSPPRLK